MAEITFDETDTAELSDNLEGIVKGNKLILVIDLAQTIGESSSGKMMGIASTGGFIAVPGTKAKMNLYIGTKI
jgi:hypothetical protein